MARDLRCTCANDQYRQTIGLLYGHARRLARLPTARTSPRKFPLHFLACAADGLGSFVLRTGCSRLLVALVRSALLQRCCGPVATAAGCALLIQSTPTVPAPHSRSPEKLHHVGPNPVLRLAELQNVAAPFHATLSGGSLPLIDHCETSTGAWPLDPPTTALLPVPLNTSPLSCGDGGRTWPLEQCRSRTGIFSRTPIQTERAEVSHRHRPRVEPQRRRPSHQSSQMLSGWRAEPAVRSRLSSAPPAHGLARDQRQSRQAVQAPQESRIRSPSSLRPFRSRPSPKKICCSASNGCFGPQMDDTFSTFVRRT